MLAKDEKNITDGVRCGFTDMGLERVSAKANLDSFSSKFIYNNHTFKCLLSPAFAPCVLANARFFFYKYPVSLTGRRTY